MCPEYAEHMKRAVTSRPATETMTPKERGERLQLFVMIESMIKDERETFKAMLEKDQNSVTGWKLVRGSTRDITDHRAAYDLLCKLYKEENAKDCIGLTMTDVVMMLVKSMSFTKKQAEETAAQNLAEFIVKKQQQPKLVKT